MSSADSYDELGRLRTKKRHGGADTETYAYNIRNWATQINSGSFTEKLYYNTNPLNARPCYNGNISYSTWTYNNGSTTAEKGYAYEYDELNRLVNAEYQQGSSSQATGSFNEQFTYDKMGNILTLQRKKDNALIDNLTFNYKNNNGSNQLNYITDAAGTRGLSTIKEYQGLSAATAGEFEYDANGNLIKDADREIVRIKYNLLNLPDTVVFANGNLIINRYDAGGRKLLSRYLTKVEEALLPVLSPTRPLEKPSRIIGEDFETIDDDLGVPDKIITLDIKTFEGYETNYAENFEYESTVNIYTDRTETTTQTLTRLHTPEGYITTVSSPQYHYYRRDHLGNNREVWLANTNTTLQRTQYYPSGLPWAEGLGAGVQNKKYNGKEFVEMHGYDTYDIVWRQYYPAIMRFQTPDPEVEEFYNISPYSMCGNNMVINVDPDGRLFGVDNLVGAAVGAVAEIGTQMVSNAITGQSVTNISWSKVGVSAAEGFLTSGASTVVKVVVKVGAAVAQSALDGNKGVENIVKGAAVNLGSGALGSGAAKLAKGVGGKALEKTANKIVGSKTAITKTVQRVTGTSTKTSRMVAKSVQKVEKAVAKEVKKSVQTGTNSAVNGISSGVYEKNKEHK